MNKLFIIGNGFDLAHGLKTRYSDFILWYINKIIRESNDLGKTLHESDLITVDGKGYQINEIKSFAELGGNINRSDPRIKGKYAFMSKLLKLYTNSNWVDIEYQYYQSIIEIYGAYQKHRYIDEPNIIALNNCLEKIKVQLSDYLNAIPWNDELDSSILANFRTEMSNVTPEDTRILVFNYTNTINKYSEALGISKENIIYIHGKLGEKDNPIIFGYGDEIDENYHNLENLNNNEFLRNMKSFSYFKAINYRTLNTFLNGSKVFNVVIMGHSCGISDRVLLNSIFSRPGCNSIKIYYHKRSETDNDYFEKTQEISRHFTAKTRMRDLIVPFPDSRPLS